MMEMEHSKLLRKIDGINADFTQAKIGFSKYWTESTYKDGSGKSNREFQITKRGCEFLAHKTTGTKGNLFTDRYMDKFAAMEDFINNPNGIVASLNEQIRSLNFQVQQLSSSLLNVKGVRKTLLNKVNFVSDDDILKILELSLAKGLLKTTHQGRVVDKDVLYREASKFGLNKHAIKFRLVELNKIIYKQVRINGNVMWCIVVK